MNRTARSFAGAGLIAILTHVALPGPAAVQAPDRTGSARLTLTGDVTTDVEVPALRCGQAAGGGGLSFQAQAGDWLITVTSDRRAGVVPLDRPGSEQVRIEVRGPDAQYDRASPGGWIQVLPALDGVKVDAPLRRRDGLSRARLVASFQCS